MTPGQTPLPFRTIEQAETSEQSAVELELVALYERLQSEHTRTRAELADTKHQLESLRLSACRIAHFSGVTQ